MAVLPWQKAPLDVYSLSHEQAGEAAWWVEPSGQRWRGHRAIGKTLVACGGGWCLAGRLLLLPPPVAWGAALGYAMVARLRHYLPGTTPACRTSWPFDSARDRPCR